MLDLGCGDGTTALPAARLGADVLGVDIAANLVEAGNGARRQSGPDELQVPGRRRDQPARSEDGRFDLVVSIFGAMFAPKPFDVAKEMVRVTRPGGRIVMGNWIPNDPTLVAQILKISSAYSPPPPEGFVSPMTWGIESNVIERFGRAGVPKDRISFARDTYTFNFAGPPSELVETFRRYYGPTMNAFEAAEKNGRADELRRELDALFTPEPKRRPGHDLDPGDLPAGDRRALSSCSRFAQPMAQSSSQRRPCISLTRELEHCASGRSPRRNRSAKALATRAFVVLRRAD